MITMAAELACMAEKGYFATLGVTFRADEQAVSKAYKRCSAWADFFRFFRSLSMRGALTHAVNNELLAGSR